MPKILIVEDDPQITKILKLNLKLSGFETDNAMTFQDAWQKINADHFDLLLLDIGLPDGNGLDLCQKVRESGNDVPIVFLSALTDEATVVKGIKNGADDYLRKPFGLEELKVRVNKFVKKIAPHLQVVKFGDLTIDPVKRVVTVMGEMITLGRKELDILTLLARKSGDIVTRENILSTLYENADLYDRTVDSHMSHLRRKIREVAGQTLQISSVYGLGYRLEWKA
ncbi:response regulator transcription factor [Peredibacter starrii]|uniref:Response regulator transcription factor n=1 Tax=Peredibacter starrii TaxID=28202 RepID=A0AAX4HLH6_9BACT|nr:response regulator transcription factor [Peredibacter starrii]WPU64152.1 response regulator transcription factor [Peredibacter starrii]